jgi:putative redox protein
MSVQIDAVYTGNLYCEATHDPSKSKLITNAPVDNGGKGNAFSPTDLVATAVGTCMLTVMGIVAKRTGLNIDGARVRVHKEMVSQPVRRIGKLDVLVILPPGAILGEDDQKRLEHAAHSCPVKQSLHPDVEIEVAFVYET